MAPTRETATIQCVSSLLVPTEPAITQARSVTQKWTAGTPLMKSTALGHACMMSFSVALENAFLEPISVTMTMTVETAVMNIIAAIRPAVGTSSLVPMASAFIRTGFVTERTTVQTLEMKMGVRATNAIIHATRESGLARTPDSASPFIKFVMGSQTVREEKMRTVLLPEVLTTVVLVCALS